MTRRELLAHAASAAVLSALPIPEARSMTVDDNPFLQGGFAPVSDEVTLDDLPVTGRLPAGLAGVYRRNGPNAAFKPISYTYPFDGDGMIHALSIKDGKAAYRNRFVQTAELQVERQAGRALWGGIDKPAMPDPALLPPGMAPRPNKNWANINVVRHGGRLLALYEAGMPYELTDDLATKGIHDFGGKLRGAMTAHPFLDPVSGEMIFYRYRPDAPPYLTVFVADKAGAIVAERHVDTGVPYMIHDVAVTARKIVFVLAPVVFDLEGRRQGKPFLAWRPELGTRIAILDRADLQGPVTWLDAEPFFVFHFLNAYDERDAIVIDHVRHADFAGALRDKPPQMARMTIAGRSIEHTMTASPAIEFPRHDDRLRGRKNRYGYAAVIARGQNSAVLRFDRESGSVAAHDFGPGKEVGEPIFVPAAAHGAETEGWVMVYVYDRASDRSDLALIDARDFTSAPVATVHLPRRVPHGLHGNWMES